MSALLERLARDVDANERTLRRAAALGTIRAHRPTAYTLDLADDEQRYLRTHWPTLAALRSALRTEPSIECAVLFGSAARGDDTPSSDLDVLVWMSEPDAAKRHALARRLSARTGRAVQVTDVRDARTQPGLLLAVLRDGRVLVDRRGRWAQLAAQQDALRRRSRAYRRRLAVEADEAREFFAQTSDTG
jgi:predicted nucleotidyltransferase